MSAVEEALRRRGATKVNLLVEPGHQLAAEFYRTLGYSEQDLRSFSKTFRP